MSLGLLPTWRDSDIRWHIVSGIQICHPHRPPDLHWSPTRLSAWSSSFLPLHTGSQQDWSAVHLHIKTLWCPWITLGFHHLSLHTTFEYSIYLSFSPLLTRHAQKQVSPPQHQKDPDISIHSAGSAPSVNCFCAPFDLCDWSRTQLHGLFSTFSSSHTPRHATLPPLASCSCPRQIYYTDAKNGLASTYFKNAHHTLPCTHAPSDPRAELDSKLPSSLSVQGRSASTIFSVPAHRLKIILPRPFWKNWIVLSQVFKMWQKFNLIKTSS